MSTWLIIAGIFTVIGFLEIAARRGKGLLLGGMIRRMATFLILAFVFLVLGAINTIEHTEYVEQAQAQKKAQEGIKRDPFLSQLLKEEEKFLQELRGSEEEKRTAEPAPAEKMIDGTSLIKRDTPWKSAWIGSGAFFVLFLLSLRGGILKLTKASKKRIRRAQRGIKQIEHTWRKKWRPSSGRGVLEREESLIKMFVSALTKRLGGNKEEGAKSSSTPPSSPYGFGKFLVGELLSETVVNVGEKIIRGIAKKR